jgi:hypothetical protein
LAPAGELDGLGRLAEDGRSQRIAARPAIDAEPPQPLRRAVGGHRGELGPSFAVGDLQPHRLERPLRLLGRRRRSDEVGRPARGVGVEAGEDEIQRLRHVTLGVGVTGDRHAPIL